MRSRQPRRLALLRACVACAALGLSGTARGQAAAPGEAGAGIPRLLTLDKALELFRARGFDLLVADANVLSAQGDVAIAGGLPNPTLSLAAGKNFRCAASQDCSVVSYSASVSDNDLISSFLTGKRGLRKDLAQAALQASRGQRDDARRTLELQLKQSYFQALLAAAQRDVARETQASTLRTRKLNERRFALGAINEADLATAQVAELEAEQSVDTAEQNLHAAKVLVAFLLGSRGLLPELELEGRELAFALPGPLSQATPGALLAEALERRPDLRASRYQVERADAGLKLARRNRFPDIGLSATYSANGSGDSNISPPNGSIGLSFTPSLLYFQSGEIRKAEADLVSQRVLRQKAEAQVAADVETAFGQFVAARRLVERMQSSLLERAQKARDLVQVQYEKGAASLLDLLNAQRTWTAVRGEYAQDLANYWIAVAQLEQATARELRR